MPDEPILPAIYPLHVKLLSRFDTIDPPKLCRQNNLPLGRNGSPHIGKIPSYRVDVNEFAGLTAGCYDECL